VDVRKEAVAGRLRAALDRNELSARAFHQKFASRFGETVTGSSYTAIHRYLRGENPQPLEFLASASDILGVRVEWLAFGDGEMTLEQAEIEEQRRSAAERFERRRVEDAAVIDAVFPLDLEGLLSRDQDRLRNAIQTKARRDALLRYAEKLHTIGAPLARVGWEEGRAAILRAAGRFIERVEGALADVVTHADAEGERGELVDAFYLGSRGPGWDAEWLDAILALFSRRMYGMGIPADEFTFDALRPQRVREHDGDEEE
jgi:hypothetical protein